VAIEPPVDL